MVKDVTPPVERVNEHYERIFVAGLRKYFMQESNEEGPIYAFDTCPDFVYLQSIKKMRHTRVDKFLKK